MFTFVTMLNSTKLIFLLLNLCFLQMNSQFGNPRACKGKRYLAEEIVDKNEGINLYNRLMEGLSGDSLRFNKDGYNVQGWLDDYYLSGKLMHRGYYRDGRVVAFKNYYENGVCERNVTEPDPMHCTIDMYCENGKHRKQISYANGLIKKQIDYYENGVQKIVNEYDEEGKYVLNKKTWNEAGNLEYELVLVDVKRKKYIEKYYYGNGQIREEGQLVFSMESKEYIKNGTWHSYDADGKNKRTARHNGVNLTSN